MSDSVTIDFIESHHLFDGVADADVALIFPFLETRKFKAGDCIISEGKPGDAIYVIAKGTVRVTKHKAGGGDLLLGEMGRGDAFGEMGVLDDAATTASVHATKPTTTLVISKQAFHDIFEFRPNAFRSIMCNIAKDLSVRLRDAVEKLAASNA